jgi:prephenate dehydrogenase
MTTLGKEDEQLWSVAASGFRDTSRLAASDLTIMLDILLTNRDAILEALSHYRGSLETLTSFLRNADESALREALNKAQNKRLHLFRQEN